MVLIGTWNWCSTKERGHFECPHCKFSQPYRWRQCRTYLTLYLVPVLPLGSVVDSIQCTHCSNLFAPHVLGDTQQSTGLRERAPSQYSSEEELCIWIAAVLCDDGKVDESEIRAARIAYQKLTSEPLSRDELGAWCGWVQTSGIHSLGWLQQSYRQWNLQRRKEMLQAMFFCASSTGTLSANRLMTLKQCQQLLDYDEQEYRRAIEETLDW
ncbi:MAG: hypothetical protein ACK5PD_07320 [Pirellulaceae bacterium]|jgi:hypothetical protein